MTPQEIRQTVHDLFNLMDRGPDGLEQDERALVICLDRLALAYHSAEAPFDDRELPDPPAQDHVKLHEPTAARFPDFGFYNSVGDVSTRIAETTVDVGDAVGDLAEIWADLKAVEWSW